jgi:hypothetical protein
MYFIDNEWRIFMKQQVIEDVNIVPQLDRACGLDMPKTRSSALFHAKMAAIRSLGNLALTLVNSRKSEIGYRRMTFIIV